MYISTVSKHGGAGRGRAGAGEKERAPGKNLLTRPFPHPRRPAIVINLTFSPSLPVLRGGIGCDVVFCRAARTLQTPIF
jgi:hypothetical protein